MLQAQICSWGNSQGVRLTKELMMAANLSVNEVLDVEVSDGMIQLKKQFRHKTLEERAEAFGGDLNLDGEGDWIVPEGREIW